MVDNRCYQAQKLNSLLNLTDAMIDRPIIGLIHGVNKLPHCFTLQSCYGHFVYNGQMDPHNLRPLAISGSHRDVEYRIAYVAFCIDNSAPGRRFLEALKKLSVIDPDNVQVCCAGWFWKKQVNSYALQVVPDRFKHMDKAILDYSEALSIERIRKMFFSQLTELIKNEKNQEKFFLT